MVSRVLAYNAIMLGLDALLAVALLRFRRFRADVLALAATGATAVALAAWLGRHPFQQARLLAFGVFVHGTIMLAIAAVAVWRRRRAFAVLLVAGALAVPLVAVYSFWVEPFWLQVTRVRVAAPVPERIRIAVLSDIQTDSVGDYQRRVIRTALREKPDLILLPGDYIQAARDRRPALERRLRSMLFGEGFRAPLGAYAVRGDVDVDGWEALFDGLAVRSFERTATVQAGPLTISALSLEDSRDRQLTLPESSGYHIVFGHAPDYALSDVDADLLIAGHTHGGQVRLPLFGPLITFSDVPRSWAAGVTKLDGGRTLVVSRGIGMERGDAPRLRFLARPEIVVIDLVPAGG